MNKMIKTCLYSCFALTMIFTLSACMSAEWKGGNESFEDEAVQWPFRPQTMKFHPFTSTELDENSGSYFIDAHVELLDQVEDQTKGLGTIRFELYMASNRASSDPIANSAAYVWVMPINSIERNEARYDPIMRLYKFRLALTQNLNSSENYRLRAFFVDDRGIMIETEKAITAFDPDNDDEDI